MYEAFRTSISLFFSFLVISNWKFVTGKAILSVKTENSSLSSNCVFPASDINVYFVEDGNFDEVPSILKSASTIKLGGRINLPLYL